MDIRNTAPRAPPSTSTGMDDSEELLAEVDEPPESQSKDIDSSWSLPHLAPTFGKATPNIFQRRESLLTRQLHSETEHTDEDDVVSPGPPRALSTQSTWSVGSTAELTSDDGHSVPSPAVSPPLPPTAVTARLPIIEKNLTREPKILEQDGVVASKQGAAASEQSVEAGLGRKRCISFACGGKDKRPPTSQPSTEPQPPPTQHQPAAATSPPKRKCALKFVCPTRIVSNGKATEKTTPSGKRPVSPPPPERRQSASLKAEGLRAHRGSDSTITHSSPKSTRKMPAVVTTAPTPTSPVARTQARKLSNDSVASTEATRFHEFGTSDDEPEEWVQEMTCHRSRLTVNDTLKKENVIRKACEEVEEEAVEEDEEEEEAIDNDDDDAVDDELDADEAEDENEDDNDEDGNDEEDDDDDDGLSDEGFRTDDEEGFAASDSEGEGSDEEWWRPGGPSTAATSIDQLDRMISHTRSNDITLASSIGSASSGRVSPRMPASRRRHHRNHHGDAMPIHNRLPATDLPDSTDFVCGTLDEDRPLEQAFINSIKQREAAKHIARPQDIDPTFPTSDPELDEEDEDLPDPRASESENLMHGELDELDGDLTARRRPSPRARTRSNVARSPPPPVRHRSPLPPKRSQQTHRARSPPPPSRRGNARSPAPRKLFGHSPRAARSPAPAINRASSPPNTRRASLTASQHLVEAHHGFASRSHVTHTASLPRGGGFNMLSKLNTLHLDDVDETPTADSANTDSPILPKRGAIDIVKGLERKRQRRKERLYAKACAKAAAKGEKAYKVKPGKGAERMREVGLELQRYHGKGEHILSM